MIHRNLKGIWHLLRGMKIKSGSLSFHLLHNHTASHTKFKIFSRMDGSGKNELKHSYCLLVHLDVHTDAPTIIHTSWAVFQRRYCLRTRSSLNRKQNKFLTVHRISHKFSFCFLSHFVRISKKAVISVKIFFFCLEFSTHIYVFNPKTAVVNTVSKTFILFASLFTKIPCYLSFEDMIVAKEMW